MLTSLKRSWRTLREGEPGSRFQDRYHQTQEARGRQKRPGLIRGVKIVAGLAIAAAGLFFMPAPGPGTAILVIGVGLLAGEFLVVAKVLDRAEVRMRALIRWASAFWGRASVVTKVLVCAVGLGLFAGALYGLYHLFFAGK